MITVTEAFQIIRKEKRDWPLEKVNIDNALGRVLAEDIKADRDFPPYDRVTMDGIAISYENYKKGARSFAVQGIQYAGEPVKTLTDQANCVEVMTGCILPVGTDTVLRYEDITIENGTATVNIEDVQKKLNVHHQGSDRREGDVIISAFTKISPAEIAVLATVGKPEVMVYAKPSICIVSTGDELVGISQIPEPFQIRSSNSPALKSALEKNGFSADLEHLPDVQETMKIKMTAILEKYDVVFLTGGVSKGKKDYVPEILENAGISKLFHKVKQRPGKPFWFGKGGNTVVFALPGNPVSTFMCFHKYVLPWLFGCENVFPSKKYAVLGEDFEFSVDLTYFLQVKITCSPDGKIIAHPIPGHGSGDHANLVDADGFLELPSEKNLFKKGEVYPVIFYR
ncbi:MAG: molybdopterin molybdotransferase MoeA [Cyclobacteriaceae bacterium]|nr:molybdopterin molybdotransferase MoeA [Cyclobacteriaceae bacterium]